MEMINNEWVGNNNNRWSCYSFTKKEAQELEKTLINCNNCSNCCDCSDCRNCYDCCYCSYCYYCNNCSYCRYCRNCSYCSYCRNCSNCSDCSCCRYCSNCSDFKSNPNRIISKNIGSRNSQTTVYILKENIQVLCGCYCGNLQEFEARVNAVHKDNEQYLKDYLQFIELVKNYLKYLE